MPTPASNADNDTRSGLFGRQRQEVVPIAGDQHQTVFAGVIEPHRWLEPLGRPEVRSPDSLHAVALGRLRQDVMVGEESHSSEHVWRATKESISARWSS
jgi:hypothetical protein